MGCWTRKAGDNESGTVQQALEEWFEKKGM